MDYKIYKLVFQNGVHFGKSSIENTSYTFQADTLFSSLCVEAVKMGEGLLNQLVEYVKEDKLIFSDAFPYINDEYYLPKPMIYIENKLNGEASENEKKIFKKMEFVPLSGFESYLKGEFSTEEAKKIDSLGHGITKVSASIRGEKETVPYRIGVYYYNKNAGLYIIVGYEDNGVREFFEGLMEGLSFSGIGGRKNSGLGGFEFYMADIPERLRLRIENPSDKFMTLSVSLPSENELEKVVEKARYLLIKRSGFVASSNYADEQLRKRDIYVFKSGSCFIHKFNGNIYDVSSGGRHSVYRYAKPLFMGVSV